MRWTGDAVCAGARAHACRSGGRVTSRAWRTIAVSRGGPTRPNAARLTPADDLERPLLWIVGAACFALRLLLRCRAQLAWVNRCGSAVDAGEVRTLTRGVFRTVSQPSSLPGSQGQWSRPRCGSEPLLILTCSGREFAHGSNTNGPNNHKNDGQRGMCT